LGRSAEFFFCRLVDFATVKHDASGSIISVKRFDGP
jgi:hypothetical protein